jgi:hypothetical protein
MIDVDLTGAWHAAKAAIPHLRAAGGGSMILTSSTMGLMTLPNTGHYTAAKHGVALAAAWRAGWRWVPLPGRPARRGMAALTARVLALDQVAVAEGRDAGDDEREPRRLGGQVKHPRPHVLAEQEYPEQAGRQRVEDREPGL